MTENATKKMSVITSSPGYLLYKRKGKMLGEGKKIFPICTHINLKGTDRDFRNCLWEDYDVLFNNYKESRKAAL